MDLCPSLRRLTAGHRRARAAAEELRAAAEGAGPLDAAAARFLASWEAEILPHCRREEEVLLPELAGRVSEADGLIVFTLGDHCALRRLARALRDEGGDRRALALDLCRRLEEHFAFEEKTLFPALQATLGRARLAELGVELQDGPAGPA